MSYALRNTIVLFLVFVLMAGTGWAYLHFFQDSQITQLQATYRKKQERLRSDQRIANQYRHAIQEYAKAKFKLDTYPKMLPVDVKSYGVYDFLDRASRGNAYTDLNFTFLDSVKSKNYGMVRTNINGTGYYRYVYNLIHTIEGSHPLAKVKRLIINPYIHEEKSTDTNGKKRQRITYQQVSFTFQLDSYYNRTGGSSTGNDLAVSHEGVDRVYNPFYPLIHKIPPNTNDLPDVEKSKLVGIGDGLIYLVDQNGKVRRLDKGDKVYLGHLESIDTNDKSATFYLNKGGIFDKVTLKAQ